MTINKKDLIPIQQIFTPTGVGLSRPKQGISPCRIVKRCLTRSMEVEMEDINIKTENITIEDMPNEDMKLVAQTCGINVAVALLKGMGGVAINVPKRGFLELIVKCLVEEYNGENLKSLCLKYRLSESFARKFLKKLYT